jgi:hypothetical protein
VVPENPCLLWIEEKQIPPAFQSRQQIAGSPGYPYSAPRNDSEFAKQAPHRLRGSLQGFSSFSIPFFMDHPHFGARAGP